MKRIKLINRGITIVLVCILVILCPNRATTQTSSQDTTGQDPQPRLLAPCIAAGIIIGIGIAGIIIINKLCKKLPPPTPPPPPPPPVPPTPPVTTNAPPVTTNAPPSGGSQSQMVTSTFSANTAQTFSPALVAAVLAGQNSYALSAPPMPPVWTNGQWVDWNTVYGPPEPIMVPISNTLRQRVSNAYSQGTLSMTDDDGGIPLPPGNTNNVSGSTNTVPSAAPYYWLPANWANGNIAITNLWGDEAASLYDISGLGYVDTNSLTPSPILYYAMGTISNLQSSTDLVTWSNYTFNAWISTQGMITVLYDGTGIPVITNYGSGDITGSTNSVPFGIWVSNEPKKFFRIVQTP